MSLGCRYSEAMIRIRHTHRAALRKSRHSPMSVGSMSLCFFNGFLAFIQESCSVYSCCFVSMRRYPFWVKSIFHAHEIPSVRSDAQDM